MVSIIGAGPAGTYSGYNLAKQYDVKIYEEDKKIGEPVQCTGIITNNLPKDIYCEDYVLNKIPEAEIIAPNGKSIFIKLRNKNLVLDRVRFDNFFADKARERGAKIILNKKLLRLRGNELIFKDLRIKDDFIIGADGPYSRVARDSGLFNKRKFIAAKQARLKGNFNEDLVKFYLGIGSFSWVVPENKKIARIGVASNKDLNIEFKKLLILENGKVLDNQGGIIPFYDPLIKISKNNIFLVGDAATQVKATTFGGIIPGLIAAKEFSKGFKNYEFRVNQKLKKELMLNLVMRKKLDRFNDKKYNELVELFSQEKLRTIIGDYDRDFPSKFVLKLLVREPRLFKFVP
ncbi:MAG: NAD(P)/FAD-dependent oxidoreductase [Candidatus Nanoarchaeia archaeon]|nr:NAD(P)/FAD-dependent oxidoreductase [Candidatus Nanoarchaeia archaeon]